MNKSSKGMSALKILLALVMILASASAAYLVVTSDRPPVPSGQVSAVVSDTAVVSPTEPVVVKPEIQPVPEIVSVDQRTLEEIKAIAEKYDCMAVQIAVIDDGYVTQTCSFGYANYAQKKLITDDTKIRVASLTKVLIGMSAMRAHQDGQLDLDASLTDQLGYRVANPSYSKYVLTLRDILTHTATLNDTSSIAGRSLQNYLQTRGSYFFSATPKTAEAWAYSNPGIRAAGGIVETLTDTNLYKYTDQHFFDPLGIDGSLYASLIDDRDSIATLYYGNKLVSSSVDEQLARRYYDIPAASCSAFAGGLTISAKDYARMMCILLRDGEYDGREYLAPEIVADMEQVRFELPQYDQSTILRHHSSLYGRELYFHTGAAYGVLAFAAYDKNANEGIVVVTNGACRDTRDEAGVHNVCAEMARYIFDNVLDGKDTSGY